MWQRCTNIGFLRSYHTEKNSDSLDPRRQTLSVEGSTWMVDLLKIYRIVDFLSTYLFTYFLFINDWVPLGVFKDELCFVKQRENKIVVTVGALLHFTHVEL